jgi:hypothetical protein
LGGVMSGFDGYDQWKTAAPEEDWPEECLFCGKPIPEEEEAEPDEWESLGFCGEKCHKDYHAEPAA